MADVDLQQFNRPVADAEAANAENALTGTLLLPRDAKGITADNNGAGRAPVNPSLKKLAVMVAGLRGWLVGNITGISSRSLKSMLIDLVGGTAHSEAAGTLRLRASAALSHLLGPGGVDIIDTAGTTFSLRNTYANWTGTAAGGANPNKTTALANTLSPLLLIKHWIQFSTLGGAVTYSDGGGGCSLALPSGLGVLEVTFPSAFENTVYGVVVTASAGAGGGLVAEVPLANKQVGKCQIDFNGANPETDTITGTILLVGRQAT